MRHVIQYAPAKTGEDPRDISQFSKLRPVGKKYLKDTKHNSLQLAQKYARIFVLGRYLFQEANNFPRACYALGKLFASGN